jgi:two-component system, NarL family, nitrate/nitrite response regulator NarL
VTNNSGTILVVDDDAGARDLVSDLLGRAGYTTMQASTGEEALAAAEADRPSLVLLDVRLPGVSGYEVLHSLRDRFGDGLPVVFVSGERTESFDRVAGLQLGADDYLVKPYAPDELIARLRRLLTRPGQLDDTNGRPALTAREEEVLKLLASGLDQKEIAKDLVISEKTVSSHIERILAKLGVHSRAQAVAVAHRTGLS